MQRLATMLLMLALPSTALAANNYCVTVAGHRMCSDPPPATPMTHAQLQALIDQTIKEEVAILQPLAGGTSSSLCSQAVSAAQASGRHDLVPELRRRCGL